jgi:peptide subunit release factor 1 (eRF1)
MLLHRARAACPVCNYEEEVWFYNSKIKPFSSIQCQKCSFTYEAEDFIVGFLELYQNVTVSANIAIISATN